MSRSRNYAFTINNYTEQDVQHVSTCDCNYICWAYEVGEETGTPHIQGFVSWKVDRTVGGTCRELGNRARCESSRGTPADNRVYIFGPYQKGDKFKPVNPTAVERGDISLARDDKSDFEAFLIFIREGHPSWRECVEAFPYLMLNKYATLRGIWQTGRKPRAIRGSIELRPWQQEFYDIVTTEGNDRVVFWCFNRSGNVGKSVLRKYFVKEGWQHLSIGSVNDMSNNWQEGNVVFDISRSRGQVLDVEFFDFVEALKDGSLTSNKYEGGIKSHPDGSAQVVVLANQPPKKGGTLSLDRFRVFEVVDDCLTVYSII